MSPSSYPTHSKNLNGDTASHHPRPSDESEQEQPRKRTRCLRSCAACRKSKQRCQLPDSSIEPSNDPLPIHLACRRCVLLENECFVVDLAPRPSNSSFGRPRGESQVLPPQTPHRVLSTTLSKQNNESKHRLNQQMKAPSISRQGIYAKESTDDRSTTLYDSSTSPPPVNDLRIFDPEVAETLKGENDQRALQKLSTLPKRTMDWVKVGMTVCRPFELLGYLLRKQSASRHLFVEGLRPLDTLMNLISSVPDLCSRYEQELEVLQIGMPFLPSFEETQLAGANADFLLGVALFMSHSNRQETDKQARMAPVLRQHCLSCVLHQPRNVYDIISLMLIALHLPLLLGSLSDGNSLDGSGLLSSAASASQSFGLDQAFSRLGTASYHDMNSPDARNACLWTALSLYANFAALAGNVERQPIIKCSSKDLDILEAYSQTTSTLPNTSLQLRRHCASVSLLIYRMRATNEIRQVGHNCALLMKVHREDLDRSDNIATLQATFDDSRVILQYCCDTLKRLQHPLASKLTSYGWQRNYCIDVLGLDLALLQLLCLSRFCEKLFERSPRLIGHESSPTDLLALLHDDLPLQTLYSSVGCHRVDIAKHLLSLLMNAVRHGSTPLKSSSTDGVPPLLLLQTIPPTHLCSSLVMAGQAITEELDGRITDGHSPYKTIGDSTIEVAEILLHGSMQSLMQLSDNRQSSSSCAKKAAQQGNLFVLSARLIDSLTRRLIVWKGLAYNSSIQDTAIDGHNNTEAERVPSYFDLDGFSPESFEDLFREILATPIQFL